MEQNKQLPGKHRAYALACSLFIVGLLLFFSAGAQQPKAKNAKNAKNASTAVTKNVTTSLDTPPVALSMKEFAKTPQGAKRRQQFGKNFGANGKDSMNIKYPDGTSLKLKMVKSPRFGNQPTSITAKIKHDKNKKPEHSTDSKGQQWTC